MPNQQLWNKRSQILIKSEKNLIEGIEEIAAITMVESLID